MSSEHLTETSPGDAPVPAVDAAAGEEHAQELRLEPELRKALEAILLVVDEPVPAETLAQVLEVGMDEIEDGLLALAAEYVEQGRGFVLRRAGGGWRMYTDPGAAPYVERFVLHGRTGKLSQAALETLAIVAYKQPVTRADISEIRGVDADSGVRNLMARGLVEEVGRADAPGQPLLYGTTASFLEKLGLDDLSTLPALPALVPTGPPPPEPAPGGYRAARKELVALEREGDADDGDDTPAPGARLTALLDDADKQANAAIKAAKNLVEDMTRVDDDPDEDDPSSTDTSSTDPSSTHTTTEQTPNEAATTVEEPTDDAR
ncbi:SMC-Scp complex subunit ScpB [Euzebya rosea]|uniref:SMC-Scp complex subunit ScpB n=1 Tax=Euzebya rosea TaxID=2052804 RepID=UPI00196ADDD0|nr:SMC-Scp complex subunit ScpB [Euzebya rosea]